MLRQRMCRDRTRPSMCRNYLDRSEGHSRNRRWVRPCRLSRPHSNARGTRFALSFRRAPPCCMPSGRGRVQRPEPSEQAIRRANAPLALQSRSNAGSRVWAISGRTPFGRPCAYGACRFPGSPSGQGFEQCGITEALHEHSPARGGPPPFRVELPGRGPPESTRPRLVHSGEVAPMSWGGRLPAPRRSPCLSEGEPLWPLVRREP